MLFFLLAAPVAAADDWTGVWTGELTLHGKRHEIELVLEHKKRPSGNFRIDEDTTGLRLQKASIDGDRISVELSVGAAAVSLEGTLAEDSIIGGFTMRGGEGGGLCGMWRVGRMGSWKEKTLPAIPKPQPIGELTRHEKKVFLPFSAREEKDFKIARTYYVAANVAGASNDNDGLQPEHRGGKHGPFREFNDWNVRGKLFGPVHEDCIKIGDQADHCFLFNNDVSGYGSQCVDNFGINILFRKNHVHHAGNGKANALGTKGGTRGVVVASNVFHDLSGGISFGGTGNLGLYRRDKEGNLLHATTDPVAVNNTFYNIVGPAVDFQSCLDGVFEGNTIHDSAAGFRVGLAPEQFESEWKELVVGLPATRGTVIRNNRLAHIAGDAMFLVEERAREGLVADGNTYYTDGGAIMFRPIGM